MRITLCGEWGAIVDTGYRKLRLTFLFSEKEGQISCVLTLQARRPVNLPAVCRYLDDGRIQIVVVGAGASFLSDAQPISTRISGSWTQPSGVFPIALVKELPASTPRARPQSPSSPSTYNELEIVFRGAAGDRMAGVLTLPPAPCALPCVFLVPWMGPCDRDQSVSGHKPLAVLADRLGRRGIASFRYDKRGIGKSGGNFATATTFDFAADLDCAAAEVGAHATIDASALGALGHSEGAVIAALASDHSSRFSFHVLVAPPGSSGADAHAASQRAISEAVGGSAAHTEKLIILDARLHAALLASSSPEEAMMRVRSILLVEAPILGLSADEVTAKAQEIASPWNRCFLTLDPARAFAALRGPVLALFGDRDCQTPVALHLPAVTSALQSNPHALVARLPDLNHLMQPALTGAPSEYAEIETTIADAALSLITDWVVSTAARCNATSRVDARQG